MPGRVTGVPSEYPADRYKVHSPVTITPVGFPCRIALLGN